MERTILADCALWIPAFAGMTDVPCEDVYQFMHGSVIQEILIQTISILNSGTAVAYSLQLPGDAFVGDKP